MNTKQPPIVAQALVRHFGSVKAVDGVDLEVQHGEIFGFWAQTAPERARSSGC
jgi:ABC-type branched-subunit amino acid transport system ATPase component